MRLSVDWKEIRSRDFEEVCYHLLEILGFKNLEWLGHGGADKGRDIVASKMESPYPGFEIQRKWVIQCKRYIEKKLSVTALKDSMTWCETHNPDCLLFITTNVLSANTRDWLNETKGKYPFDVFVWERPYLETQMFAHLDGLTPFLTKNVCQQLLKAKLISYVRYAQQAVKEISGELHKRTIRNPSFFYMLMIQGVGQAADAYLKGKKKRAELGQDVSDIILYGLAFLSWLGIDADDVFHDSLSRHRRYVDKFGPGK